MDKKITTKIKKELLARKKEIDMYSTNLSVSKVLEKDLKDINSALKLIKDGKYGICKHCGKEISAKRLLARPASSACISCKNKLQKSM